MLYILTCVNCLISKFSYFIIGALKRYFTTKKQEAVLQQKDKLQDQKKKRVLYERKKEVCCVYAVIIYMIIRIFYRFFYLNPIFLIEDLCFVMNNRFSWTIISGQGYFIHLICDQLLLYKSWLHERVTWEIVTPRKPMSTEAKLRLTFICFSRGDNFPCYPLVRSIIIILYWMLIKQIVYITFGFKIIQVK